MANMPTHEERLQELERQAQISNERLDRVEKLLIRTAEANNTTAITVATLADNVNKLVDARLHPAGNGKGNPSAS